MKYVLVCCAVILVFLALNFTLLLAQHRSDQQMHGQQQHGMHQQAAHEAERDAMLEPIDRVLDSMGVKPGMVVGEAGAGDGYFTFKLIKRLGSEGAVYANDINAMSLHRLKARATQMGLENVFTVMGEADDPLFPRNDLDMVCIAFSFHNFKEPHDWLVNLKKYMKPGATFVILEYDPAKVEVLARLPHFSKDFVLQQASDAGYELVSQEDYLPEAMILVFHVVS